MSNGSLNHTQGQTGVNIGAIIISWRIVKQVCSMNRFLSIIQKDYLLQSLIAFTFPHRSLFMEVIILLIVWR